MVTLLFMQREQWAMHWPSLTPIYAKRTMSNALTFIDQGVLHLALKQPFDLGKAEWNYTDGQQLKYEANPTKNKGLPIKIQHIVASKFNATIHTLWKTDGRMCCIYRSTDFTPSILGTLRMHPLLEDGKQINIDTPFNFTRSTGSDCFVSFQRRQSQQFERCPMRCSRAGDLFRD